MLNLKNQKKDFFLFKKIVNFDFSDFNINNKAVIILYH